MFTQVRRFPSPRDSIGLAAGLVAAIILAPIVAVAVSAVGWRYPFLYFSIEP